MSLAVPEHVQVEADVRPGYETVLTTEALDFVARLHERFDQRRRKLLAERDRRQAIWDAGELPGFLAETRSIREDPEWRVAPVPQQLRDRRVEITGPVDRKMVINALNSGAQCFMADFEDSNSPTWSNCVEGQINLRDAVGGDLRLETDKKTYELGEDPATLLVRPRGWHLVERHVKVSGEPVSASLFDFGLFVFHNAKQQVARGEVPAFYLPKLEHHQEAALWDDVFSFAETTLDLDRGTLKATVLLETFPAAFQMDEILHALRDHIVGLNAGRWDYIFSAIKTLRNHSDRVLPDRAEITMTVPFMRAYTELLVQTCHKRGAFAMGGMAAFIPNRRDPEVTEQALAKVTADKEREANDGFDGTWVAHPDLIPVAAEVFERVLEGRPNQADRQRDDVDVDARQLSDFHIPDAAITEAGLRNNIDVGIRYIESWLMGRGAAAIHNLMEDAATAEISRSQVWQWVCHGAMLDTGQRVTAKHVEELTTQVHRALVEERGDQPHRFDAATKLFAQVALAEDFPDFLTLPAYEVLTEGTK